MKQNRNWAVLGIGVGLALIIGYFGYGIVMAVEQPTIRDSKPKVIVSYISNPRGLRNLTRFEQRQFLEEWRLYLMSDADAKEALTQHLKDLDLDQRKAFVEQMVWQFKEIVVDDARQYSRMSTAERNKLVQKKAEELEGQEVFVRDLSKVFGKDIGGQDEMRRMVFDITSPEEREICMPYLDALQRVLEQKRRQRRNEEAVAKP
ncbi:MAG: hypothetical protein H6818_15055 [Phycisphaerales bacterium]|nr:hypothetical protein [Phycisphaerales bacterium]MCB9861877.1 hypothetical protein [Phycisphaerales bacterium]